MSRPPVIASVAVIAAGLITMVGCESAPNPPSVVATVATPAESVGPRFRVEYASDFRCGSRDRENVRVIYVITDTSTGVSYLAVQGCGTSQLVTEQHGKTSTTVER